MTAATVPATRTRLAQRLRRNRGRFAVLATLAFIFLSALFRMETEDWLITVLRGLAVGAITFLVASGLSLIFGLMDVLNLAHGELFMLGAYAGWTVYVRPDTFLDVLLPLGIVAAVFSAQPAWSAAARRLPLPAGAWRAIPWLVAGAGIVVAFWVLPKFPLSTWDVQHFDQTPISNSLALDTGVQQVPPHATFDGIDRFVAILVLASSTMLIAIAIAVARRRPGRSADPQFRARSLLVPGLLFAGAVAIYVVNEPLTEWFYGLTTTWRFFAALAVAALGGVALGAAIEVALIRPLYARPIYQLMLTLGLGFIIIELVRFVWGRPEFTMPKPAFLNGSGDGCPGEGLGGLLSGCSTVRFGEARIRMYNEVFIILVGLLVLLAVTLLLKRTRLGMVIRAGVEDREMVESLGINVRKVFTIVFAVGVGLAAFGGVIAAPSVGLSTDMGARVLLLALIAMAIGGLTSFPGAAAGSVLVGLLQQFIIRFGQTGIPLPWLDEPFKPSPPLVPASVILLMVVVLLVSPTGLFGREE